MNQIIILTTDCEERVAYEIEDSQLKTLFQVLFMELSSYVDMQIPEFTPLYKIINSPIKVLKNKNNSKIKTSVKIAVNDFIYECLLQRPEDLHKAKSWHVMCEDFMQLTISPNTNSGINSEINTSNQTDIADIRTIPFSENQQFTIYAIKNNNVEQLHKQNNQTGENQSPLNFSFLINKYTLEHLDEAKKHIEKFLHANKMRSSYSNIYKKIVQQKSFEEFYNAITSSPIETDLLHNDPFLLTCLYYYQNPAYLLGNMLCNKMINPRWKNGAEFSEFFLQHFSKATKELMATLTNTYDKHMLYKSLNKNLIDHKLKHKCCKI